MYYRIGCVEKSHLANLLYLSNCYQKMSPFSNSEESHIPFFRARDTKLASQYFSAPLSLSLSLYSIDRIFRDRMSHHFGDTSSSACFTSSNVINRPSTPLPSFRDRDKAKDPAHRTNPAISAPENPPELESAAKS